MLKSKKQFIFLLTFRKSRLKINLHDSRNLLQLDVMITKKLGVFAVGLFISAAAVAQDDLRERFTFGVKAGANVSNIWDTEAEDFSADPKAGFAGGVFATIPLGRIVALQPEVMFSQKGFKGSGTFMTIPYEMERTANYIDIPLLVAIRPAPFLSIVAGPQIGFQLSQKDKLSVGNLSSEDQQEFENDNWRKNMLGMHLGLDFNIRHFVISPRAAMDFQNNKGDGTSTDPRYKNFLLQLTVGYRF